MTTNEISEKFIAGKLTRVIFDPEKKSSNPVRRNENVGLFLRLPEVGKSFTFFTEPLPESEPGSDGRMVMTSPVQAIQSMYADPRPFSLEAPYLMQFTTETGSVYRLEIDTASLIGATND